MKHATATMIFAPTANGWASSSSMIRLEGVTPGKTREHFAQRMGEQVFRYFETIIRNKFFASEGPKPPAVNPHLLLLMDEYRGMRGFYSGNHE
jgi:hypothetical protein